MPKKRKVVEKDGKLFTVRGIELSHCSNTMTKAELMAWIRSHARRLSLRWKPRTDFLLEMRRSYRGVDKRTKWEYPCKNCRGWYTLKQVQVDHIIECGTLTDFDDIGDFYKRMLCEKDGFQILCKACHTERTNLNRKNK